MNRIFRLFSFFVLLLLVELRAYSQDWNKTTICNHDFSSTSGQVINILPLSNDISQNSQSLSIKSISFAEHGKALFIGNSIQFVPEADYQGIGHILYTACDNNNNCGIGEVSIMITNPSKVNYTDTIYEGVLRNEPFRFYVPETGFQLLSVAQQGQLSKIGDLEYQYIPSGSPGFLEQLIFVKDNKKQVFQLTIVEQPLKNRILVDDVIYLNKNTSRLFSVTTNDLNSPSIKSYSQPSIGSLSLNPDNTFTYTSTFDFEGDRKSVV